MLTFSLSLLLSLPLLLLLFPFTVSSPYRQHVSSCCPNSHSRNSQQQKRQPVSSASEAFLLFISESEKSLRQVMARGLAALESQSSSRSLEPGTGIAMNTHTSRAASSWCWRVAPSALLGGAGTEGARASFWLELRCSHDERHGRAQSHKVAPWSWTQLLTRKSICL